MKLSSYLMNILEAWTVFLFLPKLNNGKWRKIFLRVILANEKKTHYYYLPALPANKGRLLQQVLLLQNIRDPGKQSCVEECQSFAALLLYLIHSHTTKITRIVKCEIKNWCRIATSVYFLVLLRVERFRTLREVCFHNFHEKNVFTTGKHFLLNKN